MSQNVQHPGFWRWVTARQYQTKGAAIMDRARRTSVLPALARYLAHSGKLLVRTMHPKVERSGEDDHYRGDYQEALSLLLAIISRHGAFYPKAAAQKTLNIPSDMDISPQP